ncbi:MAG: T9SS type A sorting domain-containing protein [Saprospiraceae bacterium]|nr:T9SS type A sorting domain-containing protein [Saprospiraceae bacterium]
MCTAGLPNGDRRMLISIGPMLLQPGATRNLTISVFTAFGVQYPCPDITKLKFVDKIAQDLFENCTIDGIFDKPDAPEIKAIEKDKEITLILDNPTFSNNYNEKFETQIIGLPSTFDPYYKFEGYKIYQVLNQNVRLDQLKDEKLASLISQSDIKNQVTDILNWRFVLNPDTSLGAPTYIWTKEQRVSGKNVGIEKVFNFTEDQFATGDKSLINGKEYFFIAVAYAHNNWKDFDSVEQYGQKSPYMESNNIIKVYKFVPKYKLDPDLPQLKVTRISGEGNPHTFLLMEDDMYGKILSPSFDGKIKYKTGYGPLQGKVIDQNKLINGNIYRLEITGNFSSSANGNTCQYDDNAVWNLTDKTNNIVLLEDKPLSYIKEYAVNELGFALTLHQHPEPGNLTYENNGGIGATVEYKNPNGLQWFNAVKDDGEIRSGFPKIRFYDHVRNGFNQDPSASLSKLGDGFFVPLLSTKFQNDEKLPFFLSPAARDLMGYMTSAATNSLRYRDLNNVDIVFTSDKSKWSKCIVIETATNDYLDAGFTTIKAKEGDSVTKYFELRASPSKDENGNEIQNSIGFSYFPGYAIDVETGKRLNIFFGENSVYSAANAPLLDGNNPIGGDMIFNPSSQTVAEEFTLRNSTNGEVIGFTDVRGPVAGGQHYIYITRMEYDGCTEFAERLKRSTSGAGPSIVNKAKVVSSVTWTSFPILHPSLPMLSIQNGLIPNDLVVRLRVDNPYFESRKYTTARERACDTDGDHPVYEFGFDNDYISKVSNSESALDKIYVSPNPVGIHSSQMALHLYNLPEYAEVKLINIQGKTNWVAKTSDGNNQILSGPGIRSTTFEIGVELSSGIYFIQIKDILSGKTKILKWIVL